MGIVRTVEWKLVCPAEEGDARLRQALDSLGMDPVGEALHIRAKSSRALLKNRWAAEVDIELEPSGGDSVAIARVDMLGTKHYAVFNDIVERAGDDLFDDRGTTQAIGRLGKGARLFGRKEIRHVHHLLRSSERVCILGQGQYEGKQGIVVLTNERLFFFEKSLGSETIEEFSLGAITSIETGKKLGGERLVVRVGGSQSEIKNMSHGQADEIAREFRKLKSSDSTNQASPTSADDPLAQLEKLASLRDRSLITDAEFEEKKAEIIKRI